MKYQVFPNSEKCSEVTSFRPGNSEVIFEKIDIFLYAICSKYYVERILLLMIILHTQCKKYWRSRKIFRGNLTITQIEWFQENQIKLNYDIYHLTLCDSDVKTINVGKSTIKSSKVKSNHELLLVIKQ